MPLPGDSLSPFIESTRAIEINAPKSEVWNWLMHLGADRRGFFSYSFIENSMGYEQQADKAKTFEDFKVGDLIRGSIDERKSMIVYEFPVLFVDTEESLVLENWGTLYLETESENRTRLIIRTQGSVASGFWNKTIDYIMTPLHYLMERRQLMGIKERAEFGKEKSVSQIADVFWFIGIILSGFGFWTLVFLQSGIRSLFIPLVFGILWLFVLLILPPVPLYSLGLLVLITLVFVFKIGRDKHQKEVKESL